MTENQKFEVLKKIKNKHSMTRESIKQYRPVSDSDINFMYRSGYIKPVKPLDFNKIYDDLIEHPDDTFEISNVGFDYLSRETNKRFTNNKSTVALIIAAISMIISFVALFK